MWPYSFSSCRSVSVLSTQFSLGVCLIMIAPDSHDSHASLARGLSHAYLQQFYSTSCGLHPSRWISYFMGMIVHTRYSVGIWVATTRHDPLWARCSLNMPEFTWLCLSVSITSHVVWRAVYLLLSRVGAQQGMLLGGWGAVCSLQSSQGSHLFSEGGIPN